MKSGPKAAVCRAVIRTWNLDFPCPTAFIRALRWCLQKTVMSAAPSAALPAPPTPSRGTAEGSPPWTGSGRRHTSQPVSVAVTAVLGGPRFHVPSSENRAVCARRGGITERKPAHFSCWKTSNA